MSIKLFISFFILLFGLSAKAEPGCFQNGLKMGKLAEKGGEKQWQYLQKAQDYFLCASKEGNALAGLYAAELSESGRANKIDDAETIRLFVAAAESGNGSAAFQLSELYCGYAAEVCKRPDDAKKWLLKSVSLKHAIGANSLGVFYERGYGGEKNLDKAAACFKLSSELGEELGTRNYSRILKNTKSVKPTNCI